ncbi:uncharacterized protein LOC110734410 [Chenopodium quinoa]|uniref:uncharacterized protein LOC110734410 n=1 Tax=Chenopodium quinoa TaxID=63459 RepID=UPI000B77F5AB|nr:uncharacterized protein LOC110734410 [Chenopodium quinoa]
MAVIETMESKGIVVAITTIVIMVKVMAKDMGTITKVMVSYNGQIHGQGYGDYNQGYGNHNHDSDQNQCREHSDNLYDQSFSSRSFLEGVIEKQAKLLDIYMNLSNEKFNDMLTYHKRLEIIISQLASEFKEFINHSSLTSLSLDPKSPMNAIVTRSGRVLKSEISKKSDAKDSPSNGQIENEEDESTLVKEVNKEQVEKVKEREGEVYKPKLPYHQKFNRHKFDEQFGKFIEMLRQFHLTLPFTDVIEQMPNYAKFLKEILRRKRTCDVAETINLTKNYRASFSIMTYSVYLRLHKGKLLPTNITLQLGDRSIMIPRGKVEDVPLRVGKFIILVDFVVLDIDEDSTIPIILGRPFLANSDALIDVKSAKISLKLEMRELNFI